MKLSIVIINWNDRKVLPECLRSIYKETNKITYEVIISDNGSKDDTLEYVRSNHPEVVIIENKANLGFARGNNSGIAVAKGEYILILNPDTIILNCALDKWVSWADKHPEAGAFGCRVLNPDGSFQNCARPFPSIWRYWIAALFLRTLALVSSIFYSDTYAGWNGMSEREIDWQSGCCVMFRGSVLKQMQGFDPRFFYQFEEVDLCFRIHKAGYKIIYTPAATITHLGGQSVGRFPIHFVIESFRNRYKYFHKHFGLAGARKCRIVTLTYLWVRRLGYGIWSIFDKSEARKARMKMYKVSIKWNSKLNVDKFIKFGEEPKQTNTAIVSVQPAIGRV